MKPHFKPRWGFQRGYSKLAGDRLGLGPITLFLNYGTGTRWYRSIGFGWNAKFQYRFSWELSPWRFTVWRSILLWSVQDGAWRRENPHLHPRKRN